MYSDQLSMIVPDDSHRSSALGLKHSKTWFVADASKLFNQVTLWKFGVAIENGPFIVDLPTKDGDFP